MFVLTMLFSVLASLLLVAAIVFTFFQGVLTTHVLQVSALAVVFLSLVIASISMWYGSYHLTKPILDISRIVSMLQTVTLKGIFIETVIVVNPMSIIMNWMSYLKVLIR